MFYSIQEEADYPLPKCKLQQDFNNSLTCYECLEEYENFREGVRFWLEGVLIFVVGIIGLVCNVMSILILRLCPGNRHFNVLLRW